MSMAGLEDRGLGAAQTDVLATDEEAEEEEEETLTTAFTSTEIRSLPQYGDEAPRPSEPNPPRIKADGEHQDHLTSTSFDSRPHSLRSESRRKEEAPYERARENGVCKMHKFSLYETASRYYLVGGDITDRKFRILKIDRTIEAGDLNVAEDDVVYTKEEMKQLLNVVDDGNKSSGGLKLKYSTWGLLGFIRFTGPYYMLLITKRSHVAMIGGHYIYQIDGTELVSLAIPPSSRFKLDRHPEEARFVGILNNLDLSRSFYFSYSYDITHTLQHNVRREREALLLKQPAPIQQEHNEMFIWNHYLLEPARSILKKTYDWCLPIVHGFIDQANLSIYGRTVYITIIARRSRIFAGARFLKRGANDLGYVANDVETEQIVSEMLTTSLHAPGPKLYANPNYTSYVQHRGINLVDPFYGAAALHFDNLFSRYGAPVYVLNLVKARERTPRESKLLKEFTNAITYLNQFLPRDKKIIYKAWDMSRASKSRDQDVIGTLESIAEDVMTKTSFFRNGDYEDTEIRMQNGIARTNCIDCLDRTNAAQFVIGKRALGHQLHALGVLSDTSIDYDTDAVNLLTHMFHAHGDTIAVQYGGSHLVNTMETYRKINQWTSHSRDMVESFKRYYNNSFLDRQRQEAYNLFLGNYIFAQGQPMLWDLSTDYYLHHADPRAWSAKKQQSYIKWFHPEYLSNRTMPESCDIRASLSTKVLPQYDDYWLEYYKPLALSSFMKVFCFRMNSSLRYIPFKSTREGTHDLSPFRVRDGNEHENIDKARHGKDVADLGPRKSPGDDISIRETSDGTPSQGKLLSGWLHSQLREPRPLHSRILSDHALEVNDRPLASMKSSEVANMPKDKSAIAQWTLGQLVVNSLNPTVKDAEAGEYGRYINHPLNLPLVVSIDTPPSPGLDFLRYINSISVEAVSSLSSTEEDINDYVEFLNVSEDPLTVTDADTPKKRYKAYRQWLKGKSLFKQQRVDA